MRRPRRSRPAPLWGALVTTAAVAPLPRWKGTPHTGARLIHAGAREGILAHLTTELHIMLVHAAVVGIALTCIGVVFYLLLRRRAVIRNSVPPRTADVRVRPGQSYRQALEQKAIRR